MFAVLLVCALVVSSYVAWPGITGREPVPIPETLGGGPNHITVDLFDELISVIPHLLGFNRKSH